MNAMVCVPGAPGKARPREQHDGNVFILDGKELDGRGGLVMVLQR